MDILLLVDGEVTSCISRVSITSLLVPTCLRSTGLWSTVSWLCVTWCGFQYLQNSSRIWLRMLSTVFEKELKILDILLWINYSNFVLLDYLPLCFIFLLLWLNLPFGNQRRRDWSFSTNKRQAEDGLGEVSVLWKSHSIRLGSALSFCTFYKLKIHRHIFLRLCHFSFSFGNFLCGRILIKYLVVSLFIYLYMSNPES